MQKRKQQTGAKPKAKQADKPGEKQPAKQQVKQAVKPSKNQTAKKPPEKTAEKLNAIQRLISWLKNFAKFPFKQRNEFRYNFDTQHPQYVFEHSNGKKKSVGITHESETFGIKNMPLNENPQKGKTDKAFIRNGIVTGKSKNYSKRTLNNFRLSKKDKANVKSKIRYYKKRNKNRKNKAKKKGK